MTTRRLLTSALLAAALAGGFVRASDGPKPASTPGPGDPSQARVRRLTERFRDVNVALVEGYIRAPFDMCGDGRDDGAPGGARRDGYSFLPAGPAGHHPAAIASRKWYRYAHGLPEAEHSDLRAQG